VLNFKGYEEIACAKFLKVFIFKGHTEIAALVTSLFLIETLNLTPAFSRSEAGNL